jgi:signal transduction histidine kinase
MAARPFPEALVPAPPSEALRSDENRDEASPWSPDGGAPPPDRPEERNRRPAFTPMAVLAIGLLLSLSASMLVAAMERARDAAYFDAVAAETRDRVEARLGAYLALLRAGGAFMGAVGDVTADEFETFVHRNRLEELYPGIQGFGYTTLVREGSRDSLIAAQRATRFPDFRIWPETPPGEEEHSIVYLFPQDARNQAAIGFDMYSESTRREAMARARDGGRVAMSRRVTLVQEIEGPAQAGFLIYAPVYEGGAFPPTLAERRESLRGFVYAPFRADDLFAQIFGPGVAGDAAFRVYDGNTADPEHLLHDSERQGIVAASPPRFVRTAALQVAGRPLTLVLSSTAGFESEQQQRTWLIMLLLGLLATLALYTVTRREVAIRANAQALARRLQETGRQLEAQIDEVRELNREAQAAHAEADRANAVKSEFLAAMSHELRTPLNAIMGYADLLQMGIHGPVTTEQERALERIRRSQTHLLALINDILNYAKLEAGKVDVRVEAVPVEGLMHDLRAMTEPQARSRGVTLVFEPIPESLTAVGDRDKVMQVILNLVTNGIKFTPPGGWVRLDAGAAGNRVHIRVSDNGPGIPPDRIGTVFDPFIQIDRTGGNDGQHGVGLGLPISRDLAQLMGGELTAESEPGEGSVFTFDLPAANRER